MPKLFSWIVLFTALLFVAAGWILLDLSPENEKFIYVRNLGSSIFLTIGTALLVSNIFTYMLGTEQFLAYVKNIIKRIVVSREFIRGLGSQEKKELLRRCVRPPDRITRCYSGIEEFFDRSVESFINFYEGGFRGHMVIEAEAKLDREKNQVFVDWDIVYVLYKVDDRFEDIKFFMSGEAFEVQSIRVEAGNESKELKKEDWVLDSTDEDGMSKKVTFEIPAHFHDFNEIAIHRKIREYGKDHWMLFSHHALKPCHRFRATLKCNDGLEIREYLLMGVDSGFHIDFDESSPTSITFTHNGWLEAGSGVTAVVSLPHALAAESNKGFNRTPESSGPAKPGESGGGAG